MMIALGPSGPMAFLFCFAVLATLRPWVIGNRTVSQVQRESSSSNNVVDKPGSVSISYYLT